MSGEPRYNYLLARQEKVHEYANKLLSRLELESLRTSKDIIAFPEDDRLPERKKILDTCRENLGLAFSSPEETCFYVEIFLMPFWKKGTAVLDTYYFDKTAHDESIGRNKRLVLEQFQKQGIKVEEDEMDQKLNEVMPFLCDYFSAMCDYYTAM